VAVGFIFLSAISARVGLGQGRGLRHWNRLPFVSADVNSRLQGSTVHFRQRKWNRDGKDSETPKNTAPSDAPAYTTFSDDDVASISEFIQTPLLKMLRSES